MSDATEQPNHRHGPSAERPEDAAVGGVLDAYYRAAPGPDADALWLRIAADLGPQRPPPGRGFPRLLAALLALGASRTVAIGATAAVVAAVLLLGAVALRPQQDASAAVLDAVHGLTSATDSAFDDGELSADEQNELRRRAAALLARVGGETDALSGLSAEELGDVIARLEAVLDRIATYRDSGGEDGDELEEAEHSVRQVTTAAGSERDRRGRSRDDDDRSGSSDAAGDDDPRNEDDDDDDAVASPTTSSGAATGTATATSTASPTASASPSATATGGTPLPADSTFEVEAVAGEYAYAVGEAGRVRFAFDGDERLELLAATPNAGWTATVEEQDGSEIRVAFARNGVRARFEAAREDHRIEVSIRWGD